MFKRRYRILEVCNKNGPLYYVAQTKKYFFWYDILSNNKTYVGQFECSVIRSCIDHTEACNRICKFHAENYQKKKTKILIEFGEDYFNKK